MIRGNFSLSESFGALGMAALSAAALHRQPGGLVQRDHVIVTIDHAGLHHLAVRLRNPRLQRRGAMFAVGQRRNAHLLPGRYAGCGFDPPAIDAQFALAAHLFNAPLADMKNGAFTG